MPLADRMQMAAAGAGAAGYEVDYSCRFNDDDSAYLTHTPDSAGDLKEWTFSAWFKLGNSIGQNTLIYTSSGGDNWILLQNDALQVSLEGTVIRKTNALYRDPHAWYHVVVGLDAANTDIDITVNGVVQTSFATSNDPTNQDYGFQTTTAHDIGRAGGAPYSDLYMAQVCWIDGSQLAATSFGEFDDNGVWRPINISQTFGDNGFYLDFSSSTIGTGGAGQLGSDVSGNDNHFDSDAGGLAVNDRVVDTPTNNLATLTPLWTGAALSNGNLKAVATGGAYQWAISSIAIPESGKWVCEFQSSNIDGPTSSKYGYVGICQMGNHTAQNSNNYIYGLNLGTGEFIKNSSVVTGEGLPLDPVPYTSLIRLEYNASTDALEFFDDGASVHSATPALTGHSTLHFFCAPYGSNADITATFTGLTGTPTTDFITLSTTNLAAPTLQDGADEFVIVVDTESNIAATLATARTGWTSYLDIFKNRDTIESWIWRFSHDGSNELLLTGVGDLTYQSTSSLSGSDAWIGMSIKVDGTVGKCRAGSQAHVNGAGDTTVSFTSVGTTDYAVFIHDRGADDKFTLHHPDTTAGYNMMFNSAYTHNNGTGYMRVQNKTATSFDIDSLEVTGTYDYIVLPQSELISLRGYTPTTNADGPLIFSQHSPKAVIVRANDGVSNTHLIDLTTQAYNPHGTTLKMNDNRVEGGTTDFDLLSNGFKLRSNDDANEETHCIAITFMDVPFGGFGGTFGASSGASPATAR